MQLCADYVLLKRKYFKKFIRKYETLFNCMRSIVWCVCVCGTFAYSNRVYICVVYLFFAFSILSLSLFDSVFRKLSVALLFRQPGQIERACHMTFSPFSPADRKLWSLKFQFSAPYIQLHMHFVVVYPSFLFLPSFSFDLCVRA